MADTKFNARDELAYMTTSAPNTESAARLPSNYTRIGLVTSNPLSLSRNMIPVDDKDSGEWEDVIPGRGSGTLSVDGNRARDGNAGHTILVTAFLAATRCFFLVSTNTVGDYAWHFPGYVESYDEGSDDEAAATFSASIRIDGEPTRFAINT